MSSLEFSPFDEYIITITCDVVTNSYSSNEITDFYIGQTSCFIILADIYGSRTTYRYDTLTFRKED